MPKTPAEVIVGIDQLISLPDAVIRANQLLNDPDSEISDIGDVIAHDTALSAKLLKLVNSAFYSFPAQIDTISRAITLIGTDELRSLILASVASSSFDHVDPDLVDINAFWLRSVYCGLVAKKIVASKGGRNRGEPEFLTGLMHDVGKLAVFMRMPEESNAMLADSSETHLPLYQLEQKHLGFVSAEVGALLLETWQLPRSLWEPIRHQHEPLNAGKHVSEAWVLNVALSVTNQVEPEVKTEKPSLELDDFDPQALAAVSLSAEQVQAIASDANFECYDVLGIINPGATSIY